MNSHVSDELNPLQTQIIEVLGIPTDWEPLPAHVLHTVEHDLHTALAPVAETFSTDNSLRITKHMLSTVHGCEAQFVEQRRAPFAWNINTVRGTIAHKAIELLLNWRGPIDPSALADQALDKVANDVRESASDFINSLPPQDEAELRAAIVRYVTSFLECFPPLKSSWRPVVEYPVTYSLFGGSLVLSARMDLVLGAPGRKVILDVKTGRIMPAHRDDLRFYALVEGLRSRQAPRHLGTYSLESARLEHEPVNEGILVAAVKRTADGIARIGELVTGVRAPEVRTGPQCRWCPLNASCDAGRAYLRQLAGDDDTDD